MLRSSSPLATTTLVSLLMVLVLAVSSCGADGDDANVAPAGEVPAATSTTEPPPTTRPTSELAAYVAPAGSAATLPEPDLAPRPVAMSFDAIGVGSAPIIDVGVEANGDMEIPGASEVGWYRYGPVPGAQGSSVLAAHISWNGTDGVFRRLARAEPGQRFTVAFEDESIAEYEVVAIRQYPKDQLPDELFSTSGEPQVVLITCGGSFNRSLNSYADNIVAYAIPVAA
jgi:LPXTG-site transpeptidase (sortase) family protein